MQSFPQTAAYVRKLNSHFRLSQAIYIKLPQNTETHNEQHNKKRTPSVRFLFLKMSASVFAAVRIETCFNIFWTNKQILNIQFNRYLVNIFINFLKINIISIIHYTIIKIPVCHNCWALVRCRLACRWNLTAHPKEQTDFWQFLAALLLPLQRTFWIWLCKLKMQSKKECINFI